MVGKRRVVVVFLTKRKWKSVTSRMNEVSESNMSHEVRFKL